MPNILRGVNPVTRLALMFLLTTPVLFSVDWLSASVLVGITIALAPLCGVSWWRLGKASWPLLFLAPLSGVSMLLYGKEGGEVYFRFWMAAITENSIELAIGISLRVLAVALPVIVLARDIDPTELGDGLAQVVKLPGRFVIGAVAGVRMATLFRDDWDSLARARRARGLGDRNKIRQFMDMSFSILVMALRRGSKLATAMEARGFGRESKYGKQRTWARVSTMKLKDWVIIGIGAIIATIPVIVAVQVGTWRWLGL